MVVTAFNEDGVYIAGTYANLYQPSGTNVLTYSPIADILADIVGYLPRDYTIVPVMCYWTAWLQCQVLTSNATRYKGFPPKYQLGTISLQYQGGIESELFWNFFCQKIPVMRTCLYPNVLPYGSPPPVPQIFNDNSVFVNSVAGEFDNTIYRSCDTLNIYGENIDWNAGLYLQIEYVTSSDLYDDSPYTVASF